MQWSIRLLVLGIVVAIFAHVSSAGLVLLVDDRDDLGARRLVFHQAGYGLVTACLASCCEVLAQRVTKTMASADGAT
jgi:hypothetical protein